MQEEGVEEYSKNKGRDKEDREEEKEVWREEKVVNSKGRNTTKEKKVGRKKRVRKAG